VLDVLTDDLLRWRGGEVTWRGSWAEAELALTARAERREDDVAGSIERIEYYVEQLRGWASRPSPDGIGCAAVMPVYAALAEAELARARGDDGPAVWQQAARAADALELAFPGAYARLRGAEATVRTGGPRTDAAQLLADAHRSAAALGAAPLDRLAVDLARRARLDLHDDGPSGDDVESTTADAGPLPTLSPREREVLTLVAAGRTNRQIAEELFISPKTASVHVSNILSKLGVSTRGEAAAVAHRLGVASG